MVRLPLQFTSHFMLQILDLSDYLGLILIVQFCRVQSGGLLITSYLISLLYHSSLMFHPNLIPDSGHNADFGKSTIFCSKVLGWDACPLQSYLNHFL